MCEEGTLCHGTAVGLWWDCRGQEPLCPRLGHIIPSPNPGQPPLSPGIWGQAGQRSHGTPLCRLWCWGCSSCSPRVPSPAPPRVPQGTAGCGGHVLQADPTQNPPCCSVLSKAPPHAAPRGAHGGSRCCRGGCTERSLLQGVRAQQVPVCTRACAPRTCVCVCGVCACACGGRARQPLGAPTARPAAAPAPAPARGAGVGGGRQPGAGDREGKRGSSVRASAGRADPAEKRERSPVHGAGPQPGAGAGNRRAEPGGKGGTGEGQFSGVTGTRVPTGGFRRIWEGGSRGGSLVWGGESQVGQPGSERQVPGSGKGSSPVWGPAPSKGTVRAGSQL